MDSVPITRRTLTASAAGFAAGLFAAPLIGVAAQSSATPGAVPVAEVPQGYVSTRLRTLAEPSGRTEVTERVRSSFAPDVRALDGYRGYLLGDVADRDDQQVSVVVFEDEGQMAAFADLAAGFVASVDEISGTVETEQWGGDLLLASGPTGDAAASTPAAPADGAFLTVRIHTSAPGTDPRDTVDIGLREFIPIVSALPGFHGYLWYPTETGFVAISLFDTAEHAAASTDAAREWMGAAIADYTTGEPRVIDATVVFADTPIFG